MKFALLLIAVGLVSSLPRNSVQRREKIPGEYIIRVDEGVIKSRRDVEKLSEELKKYYVVRESRITELGKLKFLFVKGDYKDVIKAEKNGGVKYVVQNERVSIDQFECVSHPVPGVWGLDRTDQREPLTYSDPFGDDGEYTWGEFTGSTTVAYIADTGVDITHPDFGGRATWGYTAPGVPNDGDQNGHGTHCAGTIGSATYGIAKDVQLVAVKVMLDSGVGAWDDIIDGLAWITQQHNARGGAGVAKSVVNMSLGGFKYEPVDDAVEETVANGVVVVTSAGNSNMKACSQSPARTPSAVTVGAVDITDTTASFTNYGECVDIFAPGVDIQSTYPSDGGSDYLSGTSMAAPHVAGVIARYQDSQPTAPLPEKVDSWLKATGTADVIRWYNNDHAESSNLLLYGAC